MAGGTKKILGLQIGFFGLLVCCIGVIEYWRAGFDFQLLWYWLIGLGLMVFGGFILPHKVRKLFDGRDWLIATVILSLFAPLYLFGVQDIPRQMNTDEVVIMNNSEDIAAQSDADLFGPSEYFGFPLLVFWVFGHLAELLGGMGVENMRHLHAAFGVLIVVTSYFLFRLFLSKPQSVLASCVIGFNHSLFFISRMAMRDNTALLLEIVALTALVYGFRTRNYGWSLLGGAFAGLGFYTYYPSRITLIIWFAFISLYLIFNRFRDWKKILGLSGAVLIGCLFIVLPLFIANAKSQVKEQHAKEQTLLTEAGRELQRNWVGAPDETAGVKTNITQGLLTFNRPYADQGAIYLHYGYGFVDVITGILIWVGIATIIFVSVKRGRISTGDLLMLAGFLLIWLSLAFIINKAPNYTRLLIVLPFVGYLVARSVNGLSLLAKRLRGRKLRQILTVTIPVCVAAAVFIANAVIAKDFIDDGNKHGSAFGDTIRFQETHTQEKTTWYFVPSTSTSYFEWGTPTDWYYWLNFAKGPDQTVSIIFPNRPNNSQIIQLPDGSSGYLLTDKQNWQKMIADYKILSKDDLTPDSRIKAIKFVHR